MLPAAGGTHESLPYVDGGHSGSDRSRIFQMGVPTPEFGAKIHYLARFLPEKHENERNWTKRRGCTRDAGPANSVALVVTLTI